MLIDFSRIFIYDALGAADYFHTHLCILIEFRGDKAPEMETPRHFAYDKVLLVIFIVPLPPTVEVYVKSIPFPLMTGIRSTPTSSVSR